MRFSFTRAAPLPPPPKVDPLRQEVARLGSEAAVVAAACSSIADGHRKQVDLIDAGIATASELAQSVGISAQAHMVDSATHSLSSVVGVAQAMAASSTRVSGTVAALAQSAEVLSSEADASGTAIARVASAAEEIARSAQAVLRQADDSATAAERTSQSMAEVVASTEQVTANAESTMGLVGELAGAVGDISRSAQDLAQRTEHVAHSIADVATRSAEVERSVRSVAQLAREAAESRTTWTQDFSRGVADISVIVDTFTTIAERTNLLSLNAAIEAAHAGDAGRGFVVIAEELRALSDRATKVTAQVTSLIHGLEVAARDAIAFATSNDRIGERIVTAADDASISGQQVANAIQSAAAQVRDVSAAAEVQAKAVQQLAQNAPRGRVASEELARTTAGQAQAAREALAAWQQTTLVANETRAAVVAQSRAISDLEQASDVARRGAASTSRRVKEHASAAAQIAADVESVVRASSDVEAALATAVDETTAQRARVASADAEREVALEGITRTLTELRGLILRTARTANDSSTLSASLQQRVASLS